MSHKRLIITRPFVLVKFMHKYINYLLVSLRLERANKASDPEDSSVISQKTLGQGACAIGAH